MIIVCAQQASRLCHPSSPVTVPHATPCVQGGERLVSMNAVDLGTHRLPVTVTAHSQEPVHRQALSAQPNPPRNRIRLILTLWTAFDMEAAGVTQNSGPVELPQCSTEVKMFISTQRPLGSQA